MLKHIYADGRLGDIQQTGAEPAAVQACGELQLRGRRIPDGRQRGLQDGGGLAAQELVAIPIVRNTTLDEQPDVTVDCAAKVREGLY